MGTRGGLTSEEDQHGGFEAVDALYARIGRLFAVWQIGPFRLDPTHSRLTRDGREVPLQRRPVELLTYLVTARGRVVPREELVEHVWGGARVSAGAVHQALYELRTVLGDGERQASERWIRTLRGRGIRFDGPVESLEPSFDAGDGLVFVGRIEALGELVAATRRAAVGEGSIHVIRGAAGMGKTRLVQEVVSDLEEARLHVVQCIPDSPAYGMLDELVSELSGGELAHESSEIEEPGRSAYDRATRLRRLLKSACREAPRVIVIEDLHWADGPSIAVLESLAPYLSGMGLALLLTYRDEERDAFKLNRLSGLPSVRTEALKPLGISDVFVIVESILASPPSPDLASQILQRSFGIPLYVRELAEYFAAQRRLPSTAVTGTHSVFQSRLESLPAEDQACLSVAALAGVAFDVGLVEAALGEEAHSDRGWIDRALEAHVLARTPDRPLHFEFVHGLVRDTAEALLSEMDRAYWHARLGRALAARHPDPDRRTLSTIARHLEAGVLADDELEDALHYATLAARQAARDLAWSDVRRHAGRAIDWVDVMSDGKDRDTRALELQLLLVAGTSCEADRAERIDGLLERARDRLPNVEDPELHACAHALEVAAARSEGDFARGRRAIERARAQRILGPAPDLWLQGLGALSGDSHAVLSARPVSCEAIDAVAFDFSAWTARDPWSETQVLSAFALFAAGRDAAATRRVDEALRRAEARGDARGRAWTLFFGSLLQELRRDWSAARVYAREIDSICERHALSAWWGAGTGFALWFKRQHDADASLPVEPTARIVAERARSRGASFRSLHYLLAGRIHLACSDLRRARSVLDDGIAFCERTEEKLLLPELLRALGRVHEADGDPTAANVSFGAAATRAKKAGAAVFELRALCEVLRIEGDRPPERRRLEALASLDLAPADRWRLSSILEKHSRRMP